MARVAGVDGCKLGWIAVFRELSSGAIFHRLVERAADLIEKEADLSVVAIDVPIGLTNGDRRLCDTEARHFLGWPRSASVFSAPIRSVLSSESWKEADASQKHLCGRGMSQQSWGIAQKIREVDDLMRTSPEAMNLFWEAHPEVSFGAWRGEPMKFSKKSRPGRAERRRLIDDYFGPAADRVIKEVRDEHLVREVGHDDILDAFAALWTAERIAQGPGEYRVLPKSPSLDAFGLPMRIVY